MPSFVAVQEEISAMLSVPDEDLTEEQRALMCEYLDELGSQEQDKVDAFAQFVRMESARADALKAEAARLASKARTAANRIAFLKERYLDAMQRNGLQKIRGQVYALSVRKTDIVNILNEAKLPPEYIRVKTTAEPDKTAIKAALKEGQAIPGAELTKSYSLQVA